MDLDQPLATLTPSTASPTASPNALPNQSAIAIESWLAQLSPCCPDSYWPSHDKKCSMTTTTRPRNNNNRKRGNNNIHAESEVPLSPPSPPPKRRRIMSQSDNVSVRSVSSSLLADRVILQPTPPSSRRSNRSPSPSRKIIPLLARATPAVNILQPGPNVPSAPHISALKSRLSANHSREYIPRDFKALIEQTVPYDEIDESAYTKDLQYSAPDVEGRWSAVWNTVVRAQGAHNKQMDEGAWVEVVRCVFRAAGLSASPMEMVDVVTVQTQQIDPAYLPSIPASSISFAKKADLALSFSPFNTKVRDAIEPFWKSHAEVSLSHLSDAFTSTIPLVCGAEIKQTSGDSNEALAQMGIWSAAALKKQKQLVGDGRMLPFLGWKIVGHEWHLHISWMEPDGTVFVLGPWSSLKAGTGSFQETFQLLRQIQNVVLWLEEEYWPWFRDCILTKSK